MRAARCTGYTSFRRSRRWPLAPALLAAALLAAACGAGGGTAGNAGGESARATFERYGFSFRYPQGWTVREEGALGAPPSEESGSVTVSSASDATGNPARVLRLWWVRSAPSLSIETVIEAYLQSMRASQEVRRIDPGPAAPSQFRSGRMLSFDWRVQPRTGPEALGRVAAFECGGHTFLAASLDTTTADPRQAAERFQAYLDSFQC